MLNHKTQVQHFKHMKQVSIQILIVFTSITHMVSKYRDTV